MRRYFAVPLIAAMVAVLGGFSLPAAEKAEEEGFKPIFEEAGKRLPAAKTANAKDFVDTRFLEELDKSGYIDGLYKGMGK